MGSIVPATTATHGPYRKVVRVVDELRHEPSVEQVSRNVNRFTKATETRTYMTRARTMRRVYEVLECGHQGDYLHVGDAGYDPPSWKADMIEAGLRGEFHRKKRRCLDCRIPHCCYCGQPDKPGEPQIIRSAGTWGVEYHPSCLAASEAEDRAEEVWLARVREENLARRRAAGEDPCPGCSRDRNTAGGADHRCEERR